MKQEKVLMLSMGNIGISAVSTFINTYLPLYLLSSGINSGTVFIVITGGFILGVFLQPLSGRISDIFKERTGIRSPIFILCGTAVCVFIELMARANIQNKALYALMLFTMFHIYQIPIAACVLDEISGKSVSRASSYWSIMGMIGSFVMPILAVITWDYNNNKTLLDILSYIVFFTVLIVAVFSNGKRDIKDLKNKINIPAFIGSPLGKMLFRLFILKVCWWTAAGFVIPFFPVYTAYKFGINITSISLTIEIMLIISIILSAKLIRFMKIYNKKYIIIAGMIYLIIYSIMLFINSNVYIHILLMILFSITYSILITVPLSILFKNIPTHMRGTILGIDNIFLNLPQALSIGLAGIVYILFGINYIYIISILFSLATIFLLLKRNINYK